MSVDSPPSIRDFDDPRLEALIETMFLAAFADGEFADEEREQFMKNVESLTDRRVRGEALGKLMTRILGDLQTVGRTARLKVVKDNLGSEGAREAAFALAVRVVAADGVIRTSERELLLDAAEALEVDRDKAADLVRDIGGGTAVSAS